MDNKRFELFKDQPTNIQMPTTHVHNSGLNMVALGYSSAFFIANIYVSNYGGACDSQDITHETQTRRFGSHENSKSVPPGHMIILWNSPCIELTRLNNATFFTKWSFILMGKIRLQKKELVWFGCFYIFLLPQTMLPPNDQIANQSCSFGQQKMAPLLGVVEKYTRNRFQLSESVPLSSPVSG